MFCFGIFDPQKLWYWQQDLASNKFYDMQVIYSHAHQVVSESFQMAKEIGMCGLLFPFGSLHYCIYTQYYSYSGRVAVVLDQWVLEQVSGSHLEINLCKKKITSESKYDSLQSCPALGLQIVVQVCVTMEGPSN